MVLAGSDCAEQSSVDDIAEATLDCFYNTVPASLAGIVFLSGGQSEIEATENLDAMNRIGDLPWPLSFSYGRALQSSALKVWGANPQDNVSAAQAELLHRSRMNGLAAMGQYEAKAEQS